MTVLVTGATGAIGPRVVDELVAAGHRVRRLARRVSGDATMPARPGMDPPEMNRPAAERPEVDRPDVDTVQGDLDDAASLADAVRGTDAVIHLAALLHRTGARAAATDDAEYTRVNVDGTRRLVDAARAAGVRRFVFASTIAVYGDTRDAVATEDTPPAPDTPYARSKLAAERIVLGVTPDAAALDITTAASTVLTSTPPGSPRQASTSLGATPRGSTLSGATLPGAPALQDAGSSIGASSIGATSNVAAPMGVVLRLGAVYGPGIKGHYRQLVLALARRRFVTIGTGDNRRSLIHDVDVARAMVLALTHPAAAGRLFNLTDGHPHRVRDIVDAISAALGRRPPRWHMPVVAARLAASVIGRLARLAGRPAPVTRATIDKYLEQAAVDATRIRQELGFAPRMALAAGWQDVVDGLRRENVLGPGGHRARGSRL